MGTTWAGTWAGGRFYVGRSGRPVFVLERMVLGGRYSKTLDAASEDAALAELALFERDPVAYKTRREQADADADERVVITADLVGDFLEHLKGKGRSAKYRKDCRRYLSTWADVLGGADLRRVTLAQYRAALKKQSGAQLQRIASLKSFCSYLRDEGLLARGQDATLDLAVPAATPEKASRQKGYSIDHVERTYRFIADQAVRDLVRLRACCGMHHSEIDRLARGLGTVHAVPGHGEIAGTFVFPHKNGEHHIQSVDAAVLAAAQRLQKRGSAPAESWVAKQLRLAVAAAAQSGIQLEPIAEGELRHSFVTWARSSGREVKPAEGGVPLSVVAAAIGHKSASTTRRFYDGTTVPPMVTVPLRLVHDNDPAPLAAPAAARAGER